MTAADVIQHKQYQPRPRVDNPTVARRKTAPQADTEQRRKAYWERKELLNDVEKLVKDAGLASGEFRVILSECGDVEGYAHDDPKRAEYLNAVKGCIAARQLGSTSAVPPTPAKRIESPLQPPAKADRRIGGPTRLFASNFSQDWIKFDHNARLEATIVGYPEAAIGDLYRRALGCAPGEYAGTFDEAWSKFLAELQEWKKAQPKPMPVFDTFDKNPAQEGDTVAGKPADKTAEQHWIEADAQRKMFWAHCNGKKGRHATTRAMTVKDWQKEVHALIGVGHMDEYPGTRDEAETAFDVAYDTKYPPTVPGGTEPPKGNDSSPADDAKSDEPPAKQNPTPDELAKQLLAEFLKEVKELRPDVTDKDVAVKLVADVLGGTVKQSVIDIGTDSTRKLWAEHKHALTDKPADPPPAKQEPPKQQPPANGNGHKQPPVDTTTTALTTTQNAALALSPELAKLEAAKQEAAIMIKSGLLPKAIDTPEKVIVIKMMGDALGIHPIVALNNINVIAGKPTVSPQLMLALVRRSKQLESFSWSDDGETSTVKMKRVGEPEHVETFSQADADALTTSESEWNNGNKTTRTIPLSQKKNWKEQPKTMRKWRAVAAACRIVFSDITWGIASYTTEEIDPDAEVIEGEIA